MSDHFDGERFFNPGGRRGGGSLLRVLRWQMSERGARWATQPPGPVFPPPPDAVLGGHAALSFVGHATFLLRFGGVVVLTDPVFSERCSPVSWAGPRRARPPGLALDALPPVDAVLLSHNHYDHMDLASLRALAARGTRRAITTLGNAEALRRCGFERVDALDWWDEAWVGAEGGVRVTATPARHFSRRGFGDGNRSLWAGFMLDAGAGGRVLFAGDSGAGAHWGEIRARLGAPDLALLPIGAYEPRWMMAPVHMNPEEAVDAHRALGARRSVGMHFGTFQLTDEAIDAPERALAALGVAAFDTMGFGETRVVRLGA
ncbi:MAG: MBL fold metallo-hydrolase [Janthinobacterium lividum]